MLQLLIWLMLSSFGFSLPTVHNGNEDFDDLNSIFTNKFESNVEDFLDEDFQVRLECSLDFAKYLNLSLFTPQFQDGYLLSSSSALEAPLNSNVSTTVITHGWHSAGNSDWLTEMKDKYLAKTPNNLIIVDWGFYAQNNYIVALDEIREIGICAAEVLIVLIKSNLIDVDRLHIVGHSLGAHVAGVIGKWIQARLNVTVRRITALDAAKPGFSDETFECLTRNDARLVDAIHTGGGIFGIDEPFAHVDFFPNGGNGDQPGCDPFDLFCSHSRAHQLYLESIDSTNFVAKKCRSYEEFERGFCNNATEETMGLHTSFKTNGTFYLRTNFEAPYAYAKNHPLS